MYFVLANAAAFRLCLVVAFLPARASEQGNVIGLVSVYICMYVRSCHQKNL